MSEAVSFGYKVFVIEGDSIISISHRLFKSFFFRDAATLPQYAERAILLVFVGYEIEKRRPKRVIQIETERFRVKSDGSIDNEHQFAGLQLAMERGQPTYPERAVLGPGKIGVVDARAQFDKKRWAQLHPELSGPTLKKILELTFGTKHAI